MIVLGRVSAPFGVRGWLRIQPFGDESGWGGMPQWWFCADAAGAPEAWQARRRTDWRRHGKGLVASFEGVTDRSAAEALAGFYVGAPRAALPEPQEDEYYWADLIGLAVVNLAGEPLGNVASLIATGAHDVLRVIDDQGRERLLPCVAAVVREVDTVGGLIRVAWERDW